MTAGQNKVLVRRLVEEAINPGNLDVLDEVAQGAFAAAARRWVGPSAVPFLTSGWRSPNWPPTAGSSCAFPVLRDPPGEWMGHPPTRPALPG